MVHNIFHNKFNSDVITQSLDLRVSTMWGNRILLNKLAKVPKNILYSRLSSSNLFALKPLNRLIIPTVSSFGYLFFLKNSQIKCATNQTDVEKKITQFEKRIREMEPQSINTKNKSFLMTIWGVIVHTLRFFQLLVIFMPVALLYPLSCFKKTKNIWLDMFVKSVEWAGVVWIKAFQYMSHRRDMIGSDMAEKFVHLRQNAPQHSFKETKQNFKKAYGKQINQIFQEFNQKPLASGSVSQVYTAKYKGKKVAVKVRHPGVDRHIQRDINLLFFFSNILSFFSKAFSLPVTGTSMKKTLIDQIDFNNQHDNLLIFNEMFKGNKSIKFPLPFTEDTSDSVLVESFAQGVPITYFQRNRHQLNSVIARLGATTFFQMLIKNNFLHADCHGGNILVEIQQKSVTFFTGFIDYMKEQYYKLEEYSILTALESEVFRKLYKESKRQEEKIRKMLKQCKQKVVVTLIDVGMVIRLDQNDRINFVNFLKGVLHGQGEKCAEMIYNLSIFDGQKILKGRFSEYMSELKSLFCILDGDLDGAQGVQLLTGMLSIIRDHNMKLEGQFATLITNMLVLEAMAKEIDPEINILKCAVPYFKYVTQQQNNKQEYYVPRAYRYE